MDDVAPGVDQYNHNCLSPGHCMWDVPGSSLTIHPFRYDKSNPIFIKSFTNDLQNTVALAHYDFMLLQLGRKVQVMVYCI